MGCRCSGGRIDGDVRGDLDRAAGALRVLAFLFAPPAGLPGWLPWAGATAESVAIGTTVLVSAPLHEKLNAHFDSATLDRLIATNWIRTIAWTVRAGLAIAMLVAVLR